MKDKYKSMTDDELKELAMQKNKQTGCAKKSALKAQTELWDRHHWNIRENRPQDDVSDRSIEDIEYNG